MSKKDYLKIVNHYEDCLRIHGDNHLGVDWPNADDVEKRYKVMMDVIKFGHLQNNISLLDFGCGAAHLYAYMNNKGFNNIEYAGLDLSKEFIDLSRKKYPDLKFYCVDILERNNEIPAFDYIVMNGVFTEKRDLIFEEMFDYFCNMLTVVFNKANAGIAFNTMSKNVDWERDDLFHLSLDKLTSFLTTKLSRNFIIRNDYGLYEYTTYLYK